MKQKRYKRDPDAMWRVIRKLRKFTCKDIMRAIHVDRDQRTVMSFLNPLLAGGYVKVIKQSSMSKGYAFDAPTYELVRDVGLQRPLLDESGKLLPPGERQRMWSALKVMGYTPFDWRDLALVANTPDPREYIRFLVFGGYLRLISKADPHRTAKYVMIRARDTGPMAPEIRKRRTEVYDVNTQQIVWQKDSVRALDVKSGKAVWVKGSAK